MLKTKKALMFLIVLFVLTACGNDIEHVKQINLSYWEVTKEQQDTLINTDDKDSINTFVNAVNHAEELESEKIIITKPLLSFSMLLNESEEKNYHLWITSNGEGYIQRLLPDGNATFNLDQTAVKKLTDFLNKQEDVKLINQVIEFEK
ncbi:hypothetical protein [Paenisporosarcina sp.]|uniref:hypothetical protein n=1 Tax=Paenisporosarcina sp. TaxID=1932001 RepID=UPI003C76BFE4